MTRVNWEVEHLTVAYPTFGKDRFRSAMFNNSWVIKYDFLNLIRFSIKLFIDELIVVALSGTGW